MVKNRARGEVSAIETSERILPRYSTNNVVSTEEAKPVCHLLRVDFKIVYKKSKPLALNLFGNNETSRTIKIKLFAFKRSENFFY